VTSTGEKLDVIHIEDNHDYDSRRFALFELGFRPFFSAAGMFSILSMLVWMLIYVFSFSLPLAGTTPITWHAHEMVYGYSMAVIAGFLLTAVSNWTGLRTWRGIPLFGLLACWLVARVAWLLPYSYSMVLAAITDLLFMIGLLVGIALPLIRVRQWKQLGILSKLGLMILANGMFYTGALGYLQEGTRWGLYAGLYLVLALIFVMVRRVLPFFIERGVGENFTPRNRSWLDISSLILFLAWVVFDVFLLQPMLVSWLSLALVILHSVRLYDWHTPGIWKRPLLWSLYLAYVFLTLSFLLKSLSFWIGLSPNVSLHGFAIGGIGMITAGMMSRVTLGHTGRNVFKPPPIVGFMFATVAIAMIFRVVLPLIDNNHYTLWIVISQLAWITGFSIFSIVFIPQLVRSRIDGRPG
jgi:uncharacterized protein involved in response to NO